MISEIANAKKAITPDTAIQLGTVLGQDPEYWLNLENSYQLVLARQRGLEVSRANQAWLDAYPIAAMAERGWIDFAPDEDIMMALLLKFLGATDADPARYVEAAGVECDWKELEPFSIGALGAWLRKGELEAETADATNFNRQAFERALGEIRLVMEYPPGVFFPMLADACASAGVVMRLIEEFPEAPVLGAARWLNKNRAVIQLSAGDREAASFWVSFLHLAGYLIRNLGDRKVHAIGCGFDSGLDEIAAGADEFAWTLVIPEERWRSFCAQQRFASNDIWEFALSIDAPPFMVAARLKWEERIARSDHSAFNSTYSWSTRRRPLQPDHSFTVEKGAQSTNWIGLLQEIGDPAPPGVWN